MVMVYVGSVRAFAGKNVVCLGLGRRFLDDGLGLAFAKPYGAGPVQVEGVYTDSDAWMVNQVLGLGQAPGDCCPVVRTQDLMALTYRHQTGDLMAKVRDHCQRLGQDKDVLLLCGSGTLRSGAMAGIGGYDLVLELGAKAIIVERYENDFFLDDLISAARRLGDNLAGVVINGVDQEMNAALEEQVIPFLRDEGITTFGSLPKDHLLASVTVRDLAERMGAKTLSGMQHMDRLVERMLIGAMQVGHARRFFGGGRNFACIVGGDRPDMQMAAIEGGAACLILTGDFYPNELILSRAEEHEVPVLVVRQDTFSAAHKLELIQAEGSLAGESKTGRAIELAAQGIDFPALYKALGIAKS